MCKINIHKAYLCKQKIRIKFDAAMILGLAFQNKNKIFVVCLVYHLFIGHVKRYRLPTNLYIYRALGLGLIPVYRQSARR